MKDVIIIGGGLAGLCNAIQLAKAGYEACLVEKKHYPFHKVCGEYVSNETLPFLDSIGLDIDSLSPSRISRFRLVSPKGRMLETALDLGGFGISRYVLDDYLYRQAMEAGVEFVLGRQVNEVEYEKDYFQLKLSDGNEMMSRVVIGSYGKRSKLDRELDRSFFKQRSPYIGVKYHIRASFPADMVALYNFEDGYCGINAIEDDKLCLCYLTTRQQLKKHGNIPAMEQAVLYQNPLLRPYFTDSEMLYDKPEVINEISFARKEAVKDHILMSGDAAGMIAPLCGNGMAMAIHSAKLCAAEVAAYLNGRQSRQQMEQQYALKWNKLFGRRLWAGRQIQALFGSPLLSEMAVSICRKSPAITRVIMKNTHGKEF